MASSSSTQQLEGITSSSIFTAQKPLFAPPKQQSGNGESTSQSNAFDEQDERIYFDKQTETWKCEANTEDDIELEWSVEQRSWVPVLDDELLREQQAAYRVQGVDEDQPAAPILKQKQKKRQRSPNGEGSNKQQKRRINTSVYISGLPLDCTKDEVAKVFSRYGVLNEDDDGEPKVKMYADTKTGMFKGEALVTYFKQESVELAINVLDESCLRAAEGRTTPIMRVMQAEFGNEKQKGGDEVDNAKHEAAIGQANEGLTSNTNLTNTQRTMSHADKKRAQKRYAKMNNKLLDWDSDSEHEREELANVQSQTVISAQSENIRQVCLRRMFTIAELEEDPTLLLDLKEDVREECESLGKVTNVILWDKEPEGIMTIKFAQNASALECVQKMDGRFFGGRQIIAHLLPGKPKFRRSDRGDEDLDEEEEQVQGDQAGDRQVNEEQRRKDAFGEWLEGQ